MHMLMTTPMTHHGPVDSPLRARREALGLSRERLGAAAGGISSATIVRAEAGSVRTNYSTFVALARALGCRVEDIMSTTSTGTATNGPRTKFGDPPADHGKG